MKIKRFSMSFGLAAALAAAAASAIAAPTQPGDLAITGADGAIVLVQSVKERPLEDLPPVDVGRTPPPSTRTSPPPPPVPSAPRISTRTAPPSAEDDSRPPAREVPPPPTSTSRVTPSPAPPPPRYQEPTPIHRAAPRGDEAPPPAVATPSRRPAPPAYEEPPPTRRADTTRRTPSTPSAFYSNCTQQCHLSCEASFEACNGDSSPAKPACVKKLEACRVERCACRFD